MRTRARQSFKRYLSLSAFVSGLTTLTIALAFKTAQKLTTVSMVLSANTTTRSPRSTPRFFKNPASALERRSISR